MTTDVELDVWREQWQADTAVPLNLRRNVERQSRLMKIGLVSDTIVTIVMGGGTTALALRSPGTDFVLVAIATWLFLAAAWAFVLTANRGLWTPSAIDTAAFVNLSVRRCRSVLATLWFAAGLFLCEVGFGLGWAYNHAIKGHETLLSWLLFSSLCIDVAWIFTVAFFGAIVWYQRKKRAELASLLELRREMAGPTTEAQEVQSSAWNGLFGLRAGRLRGSKKKRPI